MEEAWAERAKVVAGKVVLAKVEAGRGTVETVEGETEAEEWAPRLEGTVVERGAEMVAAETVERAEETGGPNRTSIGSLHRLRTSRRIPSWDCKRIPQSKSG